MLLRHNSFVYFSRKLAYTLAFEYFISKKTLRSVVQGKKVSKPIVRISVVTIALAVIVNLITVAVVTGFQQEVRQKISGFGSHMTVMSSGENSIYESEPIRIEQPNITNLKKDPNIKSISPVGYKPVLFQSAKNIVRYKLPNGKDTTEVHQDVYGAVIKGVDKQFDWNFFRKHLVAGRIPLFSDNDHSSEILISQTLANHLHYKIGDNVSAFFVRNQPVMRKFTISGIYKTGLEELDKKIAVGDLNYVQELNDWGIHASIEVADTMYKGQLVIKAAVTGGNGNYRYDWGEGYNTYSGFTLCPIEDTIIRVIASDYWSDIRGINEETTLPDTAYLHVAIKGIKNSYCDFKRNDEGEIDRKSLNQTGSEFSMIASDKVVTFTSFPGKGSSHFYVGGFEIMVKNWATLKETYNQTKRKIDFIPTKHNEVLQTSSIMESQQEIFVWLDFLDINVFIILVLMILIGIINMGSALLVLILIRSNFIGIMKALGATNKSIRKIFLIQAAVLISRGIIWGNIIGLSICFTQKYLGIIQLNPEVYYLSEVPIELKFWHWLFLNLGTLLVCVTALIIPSMVVSRINPVKTIKFN